MLNSGYEMPIIGLGTWTLSDDEAENSVYHAIKSGKRLIDTARYYGNEVGVGRGLKRAIDEGIVTRKEGLKLLIHVRGQWDEDRTCSYVCK